MAIIILHFNNVLLESFSCDFWKIFLYIIPITIIHVLLFYIQTKILLPTFLDKAKYFCFIIATVLLFIIVLYAIETAYYFIPKELWVNCSNELNDINNNIDFFSLSSVFLNFTQALIILLLSFNYYYIKVYIQKERALLLSELKILKYQISPHFLFNALHNINSMVYRKSELTNEAINNLANLLRHILYEGVEDKILVKKEFEYIKSFSDLMNIKYENKPKVNLELKGYHNQTYISPLILINFMENAYKYAGFEIDFENAWIDFEVQVDPIFISIKIKNSKIYSPDIPSGGLGIVNVKKRLDILYPKKYKLIINNKKDTFEVLLKIKLND